VCLRFCGTWVCEGVMSFLSWLFGAKLRGQIEPQRDERSFIAGIIAERPSGPKHKAFKVPNGPFRFIALDVETANSDASSICQIGLACVRLDGSIHVTSTLIDPEQPFSDFNVQLHGIGPSHVRGAPTFPTIFRQIAPLLAEHTVIQHSPFDRNAIHGACRSHRLAEPNWVWIDSVQIARRAWPEFKGNGGHGLGHLKKALSLKFLHHDAGEDAKAAAMVVLRAERHTGQRFEDLASPARKTAAKARKA
jgi:DNA polymerase-3 subunit epsilon